jgi:hypothetical protein
MQLTPDQPSSGLVARLLREGGVLKIALNDRVCEPLAFRSFRPEARNISEFYAAGLRLMNPLHTGMNCTLDVPYSLFGEVWTGPGEYDFAAFDRQMELFVEHAPDAYLNIMLQLDTRDWYLQAHPECSNTYRNLVEMAGHEPWRAETARFLGDMLGYVEGKYGDRVFAYTLLCGSSTEWFTNPLVPDHPEALIRPHPLKEAAFRHWTGDPEAVLPSLEELHHTSRGVFRHPREDAAALRYWHFHHQIIGEAIVYFAGTCQETLQHRKLLGLFYGYLTQLDPMRLLREGHLGYEQVWRCPDLDMLYAPAKYGHPRSFEGASGYLTTVDSVGLSGKLYFQEVDHTTHIAPQTVENGRAIPGSDSKLKDEFQSRMVLRREFALARAKRTALWWFDLFGGYYYTAALAQEVADQVRVQERLRDLPLHSAAQIAVFGDVESMYYVSGASPLAADLLVRAPDELARLGAPYDIYTLSDIDRDGIPWEQYRLVVFLNAFTLPPARREFIRSRLPAAGRSLLWLYAPGYVGEGDCSVEGISAVTGMRVVEHDGADSLVEVPAEGLFAHLRGGLRYAFSREVQPLFQIEADQEQVWGRYVSDGAPALASRQFPTHTAWYSAVGNLPTALWREIARAAGVHIYHEGTDPLYINSRLIGIHMQSGEEVELSLPVASGHLEELFDGGEVAVADGRCRLAAEPGVVRLYLLTDGELRP